MNLIVQSFFAFIKYTKPQDGDSISDIEDDDEIDYQTKSRFDDLETIEEETEEATSASKKLQFQDIGVKLSIIWRKMKKIIRFN